MKLGSATPTLVEVPGTCFPRIPHRQGKVSLLAQRVYLIVECLFSLLYPSFSGYFMINYTFHSIITHGMGLYSAPRLERGPLRSPRLRPITRSVGG